LAEDSPFSLLLHETETNAHNINTRERLETVIPNSFHALPSRVALDRKKSMMGLSKSRLLL